jgi:ABC-type branched-subunit amino acid transport system substrate-binding protein
MGLFSGIGSRLAASALLALAACAPLPPAGQALPEGPVQVALLVPAGSGDAATDFVAESLTNAARMAEGDLAGREVLLEVLPTGGTAEGAAAAAARALEGGAMLILGPLYSAEVAAVAPLAAAKSVPVLALSNNTDVQGSGTYLLGVTHESVGRRLTGFAAARGLTRLAVVHPDSLEGAQALQAVEAAAAGHGVTVVARESYPLTFEGISAAAPAMAAKIRAAGASAVILTDTPTGGLAFVAGGLRAAGLGASGWQFAGLTRWDASADALKEPALAGGWFTLPDPGLTAEFEARYLAAWGKEPHDLAGLGYDAVAAAGALIRAARADGGPAFSAERITDPAGFAGVGGVFRFLPEGGNERGLAVMQVGSGGTVTVLDPAPRSFAVPES